MNRSRPNEAANSCHPLSEQLDRIADELMLIRTVMDELRTDFQWAVQNGRVVVMKEHSDDNVVPDCGPAIQTSSDEDASVEANQGPVRHVAPLADFDAMPDPGTLF